jgi:integrase
MPKFTDRILASLRLEPGRKDRLVFDSECRGLGVRVTPKSRAFLVQWHDPTTRRKVREPIGVWGAITIEQARDAARARLGSVAKGVDPRAERLRQRAEIERARAEAALTFDKLVDEWATLHLKHRRPRYAAEAVRAIRYGLAHLLKLPAARISRSDAVNSLDRIIKQGKALTASRTAAYARAAYAWAKRRAKVPENPFSNLPITGGTAERDRVLTDAELSDVWAATDALSYPFGPFYKISILTLQRREEVAGMRWSEISSDLTLWRIPGERMKNGRAHDVHLSPAARDVLQSVPRIAGCDFVFSSGRRRGPVKDKPAPISGFSQGKRYLDKAVSELRRQSGSPAERYEAWRLHDIRRTGVTKLAALGFDSIVVDKLLAHQPGKLRGVAAVYQRHDFARERAVALDAWAAHVTGTATENVITLRGHAR